MFGQPLEKIMGYDGSRGYPIVVLECVELLRERGMDINNNNNNS
jgi:hypothetical protein